MNRHGFLDALLTYEDRWVNETQPYGVILCTDRRYQDTLESYGETFMEKLLEKQACLLRELFDNRAVLARLGKARYGVVLTEKEPVRMKGWTAAITKKMDTIHKIGGNEVTVDFVAVSVHTKEPGVRGDYMYQIAKERLDNQAGESEK